MSEHILDIRSEKPSRRQKLITEHCHALEPGTGILLIIDHDPRPLYHQFEAEHTGEFEWEYLVEGPKVWQVRISRPAQ